MKVEGKPGNQTNDRTWQIIDAATDLLFKGVAWNPLALHSLVNRDVGTRRSIDKIAAAM